MTRNLFEATNGLLSFGGSFVQHDPVDLDFPDDGMTRQEFAEECDINALMARYQKTGLLPQDPNRRPIYGEFADLPSFMEAQQILMDANDAFMALPAVVRRQFENDPAKFVAFAEDEKNIDQLRVWGLAEPLDEPKAPEEPPKAPIAPVAASGGSGASAPPPGAATQSSS